MIDTGVLGLERDERTGVLYLSRYDEAQHSNRTSSLDEKTRAQSRMYVLPRLLPCHPYYALPAPLKCIRSELTFPRRPRLSRPSALLSLLHTNNLYPPRTPPALGPDTIKPRPPRCTLQSTDETRKVTVHRHAMSILGRIRRGIRRSLMSR